MKKIGKYLSIAFFLVLGATFADQVNGTLDFLIDLDYGAIGTTIADFSKAIFDGAVDLVNYIIDAVNGTATEPMMDGSPMDGSGTVSSTLNA